MNRERVLWLQDGRKPVFVSVRVMEHKDGTTSILARFPPDKPLKVKR